MDWKTLLCSQRLRDLLGDSDRPKLEGHVSRIEFDRDYDRAVFSTPVRRLQDKTQVFPLDANDSVRTRLTHSLEVSTLARGLTRRICAELEASKRVDSASCRSIESIAATCALIHDIGNPPFGHAGEQAIAQWFEKKSLSGLSKQQVLDLTNFEGNAQTLRIVTRLQILADFHGLNLTVGCLSAAMKYTARSNETSKNRPELKKTGYFSSENDVVAVIQRESGTGKLRNPIAHIVEACDDIVYATVDIEDGVKKGVLSWRELNEALFAEKETGNTHQQLRAAIGFVDDYVKKSNVQSVADDARVQLLRTRIIADAVASISNAFVANYDQIMSGVVDKSLLDLSDAAGLIEAFKSVGRKRVYVAPAILKLELLGRKVITDLLDVFWEGANAAAIGSFPRPKDYPGKSFALMSNNYRLVFERALSGGVPLAYAQAQLVADYVCGMSDGFALGLRNELYGIS